MARDNKKAILTVVLALVVLGISFLISDSGLGDLSLTGLIVKEKADLTIIAVDGSNNNIIRDARVYVREDDDSRSIFAGRTRRDGSRTVRLFEGTYEITVTNTGYDDEVFNVLLLSGDSRNIEVLLFPEDYVIECRDGTPANTCSTQPFFCDEDGKLTERCDLCSCPQGSVCSVDGSCQLMPGV